MPEKTEEVTRWFQKAVGTDKCTVEIQGQNGVGEGYMGDILFAKIILETENDKKEKELFLVAKVSKADPKMKSFTLDIFKREVTFYNDIVPIFRRFQKEKNIKETFNAIPKCYKAFSNGDIQVIVLENLKNKGYEMHSNRKPMNLNHIKLVLKQYAKFHAISFALKDQQSNVYSEIEEKCSYIFPKFSAPFEKLYDISKLKITQRLCEAGREDLVEDYLKLVEKGVYNTVLKTVCNTPAEKVVIHGDCHNNNFLFNYENSTPERPSNVRMLDFQFLGMHSPMIDLSYFLYTVSSKAELSHFKELMEFYHKELSSNLTELGSDVNKLYPISKMWDHWKNYSFFGFNQASCFLDWFLTEGSAMEIGKVLEDAENGMNLNEKMSDMYLERLAAIVDHHINYKY